MKILYIMHVEWGWIKQRPHFIAEELSKNYNIKVYYQKMYSSFTRNTNYSCVKRSPFFAMPKKRIFILGILNKIFLRIFFYAIIKFGKYDIVYLTHPDQVDYIYDKNIAIIYDCMDDHGQFKDSRLDTALRDREISLFRRAKYVLFSSTYLYKKNIRHRHDAPTTILLNGISSALGELMKRSLSPRPESKLRVFYVGTISDWFDFEVIEFLLSECPNITFTIIGPSDIDLPNLGNRVHYMGSVDHSRLQSVVEDADAFIMPFKVTELIRSVDPVKMYEYISFQKPIISVYYEELDKFSRFLNFYRDSEDLTSLSVLINSRSLKTFSYEEAKEFITASTWTQRVNRELRDYLNNEI